MCNKQPPPPESSDPAHLDLKRAGRRLRGSPGAFPPPMPPPAPRPRRAPRDGKFIFGAVARALARVVPHPRQNWT